MRLSNKDKSVVLDGVTIGEILTFITENPDEYMIEVEGETYVIEVGDMPIEMDPLDDGGKL